MMKRRTTVQAPHHLHPSFPEDPILNAYPKWPTLHVICFEIGGKASAQLLLGELLSTKAKP